MRERAAFEELREESLRQIFGVVRADAAAAHVAIERIPVSLAKARERFAGAGGVGRPGSKDHGPVGGGEIIFWPRSFFRVRSSGHVGNVTESTVETNVNQTLNAVKMRVLESGRVFQSVPEHSIHADVREPDEDKRQLRRSICEPKNHEQQKWPGVSVDNVVGRRADFRIDEVTEHEQVRREKENGEEEPTAVELMITGARRKQNGGAFNMQKNFW